MQSLTDILSQYAQKYHSLGMAVHPLGFGGKNPLAEEWQKPPRLTIDELNCVFRNADNCYWPGLLFWVICLTAYAVLDFDSDWQHSLEHFLDCWLRTEKHRVMVNSTRQTPDDLKN